MLLKVRDKSNAHDIICFFIRMLFPKGDDNHIILRTKMNRCWRNVRHDAHSFQKE